LISSIMVSTSRRIQSPPPLAHQPWELLRGPASM
jgi:hypothetical protein